MVLVNWCDDNVLWMRVSYGLLIFFVNWCVDNILSIDIIDDIDLFIDKIEFFSFKYLWTSR